MPRLKEFEPSTVLHKAMMQFWDRGYLNTSMDDLVRETAVSRYGFYSTFGDKHALFLKAMDYYSSTMIARLLEPMEQPDASVPEILAYFNNLLEMSQTQEGQLGCLIVNTAVEMAQSDDPIAQRVGTHFARMRAAFRNALHNAVARGEMSVDQDGYADYLVGVANGFVVCVRANMGYEPLQRFFDVALTSLSK